MFTARKAGRILAIAFALCAFFWQTTACFAEHAGLITCHEQTCGTNVPADDETQAHPCHSASTAVLLENFPAVSSAAFGEIAYHATGLGVPDAPIREIEYPPQLRS